VSKHLNEDSKAQNFFNQKKNIEKKISKKIFEIKKQYSQKSFLVEINQIKTCYVYFVLKG